MTREEMLQFTRDGWVRPAARLPLQQYRSAQTHAHELKSQAPWQDMLSGIHNPFGHHACPSDAWTFLDLAESPALLDFVAELIGPDIILWDSELYFELRGLPRDEAECWPVHPLSGILAILSLETGDVSLVDITRLKEAYPALMETEGTHYVIRYMPASSHFNRDSRDVANVRAAAARPLINYTKRPIWLVRGKDLGNNDLTTGFSVPAARWVQSDWLSSKLRRP